MLVAAPIIVAVLTGGGSGRSSAQPPLLMSTRIDAGEQGVPLPRSFLGFSTEWPLIANLTGTPASGANAIYEQLIANLSNAGGGTPTLRVGGNSQDFSWWNSNGALRPFRKGVQFDITPAIAKGMAVNAARTGQRMILGLNLAADDPQLARNEAAGLLGYIRRRDVLAFEVGNEPAAYSHRQLYSETVRGRVKSFPVRRRGWNTVEYLREFDVVAAAVRTLGSGIRLAGPAGYGVLPSPTQFLAREHGSVKLYTQHAYPLSMCKPDGQLLTAGDPEFPTVPRLLGRAGTYGTLRAELAGVSAARRWGIPMQITEMNSIGCGAPRGYGLKFGPAIWALDQFFQDTAIGIHGIDVHVANVREAPIAFFGTPPFYDAAVGPIYYAMLLYAEAVGSGGELLLRPLRDAHPVHGANVRVWAVRSEDGTLRIVVINKELDRSGTIRIEIPGSAGHALLTRLQAAPSGARYLGVLGGQRISNPTRTGALEGARVQETVPAVRGVYSFNLPRLSAGMLIVSKP